MKFCPEEHEVTQIALWMKPLWMHLQSWTCPMESHGTFQSPEPHRRLETQTHYGPSDPSDPKLAFLVHVNRGLATHDETGSRGPVPHDVHHDPWIPTRKIHEFALVPVPGPDISWSLG